MPKSRSPLYQDIELDAEDARSGSANSLTSSGAKRKRGNEPKFYAVRAGKIPDIYHSWSDCLAQVRGFKGAIYKSFTSLTEAEAFMRDDSAKSPKPVLKYYAVQNGRTPGVYVDWPSAQKQITGWKHPKHKSFATRAEAEAFVAEGKGITTGEAISNVHIDPDVESEASMVDGRKGCKVGDNAPTSKKQKKNEGSPADVLANGGEQEEREPGTGPLPPDAEDGFDRTVTLNPRTGYVEKKTEQQLNARKMQPTGESKGVLKIYTDGSALGNGRAGAIAGVGVYFGPNDPRNVSEALAGPRQTNQRAELTGIQRALDIAPIDRDVMIYSDSSYSINCVTVWFQNWRKNDWKNTAKKPVENKDLIELIINRIEERNMCKAKTEFKWLKGHANDPGNQAADSLAVNGAMVAKALSAAGY
ncbi:RnaseH-domain-containing protein [Glonium stellatum]|uniref:Ribonuclease H n=1 Tax=Glonium stellatum TaxID=574774 RepID=A0A8E2EPQ2_9PEZI|nr:RnaseH-domain-containing protein [Glonium stellatum]